jgi:hypothetical protein
MMSRFRENEVAIFEGNLRVGASTRSTMLLEGWGMHACPTCLSSKGGLHATMGITRRPIKTAEACERIPTSPASKLNGVCLFDWLPLVTIGYHWLQAQFGISSDKEKNRRWNVKIRDDPVLHTNALGTLVYVFPS